ncbi:SAM-dependent methyltransferase [Rhizobium sp. C4]|uniref:SAM-dependent methyltransferase n=1 Tax=Rhizobium sp. C4 TaxID=1349800 RepID=UPI001E51668D|nr:cyclopropane-fatty-acyl-phospholipid synthase family protein [Rhizobium sp. C4]MCD2173474.1 cyclopropane-fatty-acyl-phospholipid synthase family protein [Rhizobium sp. C4]
MTMIANVINAAERVNLPDWLTAAGVEFLVGRTGRRLQTVAETDEAMFFETMKAYPIAIHTDEANEQHYEVPAEFFGLALGARRKYSCCFYDGENTTLDQAEVAALKRTVENAGLVDGQTILELGCGWGSLSLYMAEHFPNSAIVAVSNSASQRAHIESVAKARGFKNLEIRTANMTEFDPQAQFDRIVSVEMFEHMSNWHELLTRTRSWLKPDGRLFMHIFTHRDRSYRFDHRDRADWIAQHFFTGGIMPAHDLIRRFCDIYKVEQEWRWSGQHYEKTARHWLENFDNNDAAVRRVLSECYGKDAQIWHRRWRLFFLATAGLFGHNNGETWGVSHYRLSPA